MKKFAIITLIMAVMMFTAACSNKPATQSSSEDVPSTPESKQEVSSEEPVSEPETKTLADMMPDMKKAFPNSNLGIISDENSYFASFEEFTDEEAIAFIDTCKALGYTKVSVELINETGVMYDASTKDGLFKFYIITNSEPKSAVVTFDAVIPELPVKDVEGENINGVSLAGLIPSIDKMFKVGEISVIDPDGGKMYLTQVIDFDKTEVLEFIKACQAMGFKEVKYNTENDGGIMFGAYTEDGKYWVEVLAGNENKIAAITCKISTKYKKN